MLTHDRSDLRLIIDVPSALYRDALFSTGLHVRSVQEDIPRPQLRRQAGPARAQCDRTCAAEHAHEVGVLVSAVLDGASLSPLGHSKRRASEPKYTPSER